MSRIYFNTPSKTVAVMGSERAWMSVLVSDLATGLLHLRDYSRQKLLRSLVHPDHPLAKHSYTGGSMSWHTAYDLALTQGGWPGDKPLIQYDGKEIDGFQLILNSALTVGSDAVKLAARLHGQCEIHTWVEGPDRAWLAHVIDSGLQDGVFRAGRSQGWDDVSCLLRENDTEPVVTSYSVTDDFPSYMIGDWMPPWPDGVPQVFDNLSDADQETRQIRADQWYELSGSEQWDISMNGLRADHRGLQLRPDNFRSYRFGHRLSVLDLFAHDWETRVRGALGITDDDHEPE